ncbi:hypothetical protein BCS96_01710 [Vibrio breoganii]|nr:hypothetical protein BCT68_05220 [Vibrio breoganii]PMO97240.1 hypothetical protein BCS96_01710 [Vibrio breoganii]
MLAAVVASVSSHLCAAEFEASVPSNITTPDVVQTKTLGTLNFSDGMPSAETVSKINDQMFITRGTTAFLDGIPQASMQAFSKGFTDAGVEYNDWGIYQNRLDAKTLLLTANTTVIYAFAPIELDDNDPVVVEVPSGVLGIVNNANFAYAGDLGMAGPDAGKGGKYLLVSTDYKGDIPEGYHVIKQDTVGGTIIIRHFAAPGEEARVSQHLKDNLNMYKLSEKGTAQEEEVFTEVSGVQMNTIHASNADIYTELDAIVQREDVGALGEELTGTLQAIGIEKGKEFNPTDHEKELLDEAAKLANAYARSLAYSPTDETIFKYEGTDSTWFFPFSHKNADFKVDGTLYKNDRSMFHYVATFVTPSMVNKDKVGQGTDYVVTAKDSDGEYLTGDHAYTITLPAGKPAEKFWSFMVYSGQSRSMLETDQRSAGLDSTKDGLKYNEDGSITLVFSPEAPNGDTSNWVQTLEGKSFNVMFRTYAPTAAWFDETWKLGNFQKVEEDSRFFSKIFN